MKYTVRWGRVPGSTFDAWIVRDPAGDLLACCYTQAWAVQFADRVARRPAVSAGAYL